MTSSNFSLQYTDGFTLVFRDFNSNNPMKRNPIVINNQNKEKKSVKYGIKIFGNINLKKVQIIHARKI
jgi:hypothetical protein